MAYDMLGLVNFNEVNTKEMEISFEIPDNCFYDFTNSNGDCKIEVKLNPGETAPSTTFVNNSQVVDISNNNFSANFEQYEYSGRVVSKPKATIIFN